MSEITQTPFHFGAWTSHLESLKEHDPLMHRLLLLEQTNQHSKIYLSAATSILPEPVWIVESSPLQNIDAEGHPPDWMVEATGIDKPNLEELRDRFYARPSSKYNGGTFVAAVTESLACRRIAEVFFPEDPDQVFATVQPATGSIAVLATLKALVPKGGKILSLSLASGGHLSHGSSFHESGREFKVIHYGLTPDESSVDYEQVRKLAKDENPRVIIAGFSSFSRAIDWGELAEAVQLAGPECKLIADISHIAGLIATSQFPSPLPYADIVVSATYKTLLGPNGAFTLTRDKALMKKIRRAIFPGIQSAPIGSSMAAIATSLQLTKTVWYQQVQKCIRENASALFKALTEKGLCIAFGGTDNHIVMLDFRDVMSMESTFDPRMLAQLLEQAGVVCNPNVLPGDQSGGKPSGLRLGTTWPAQMGMRPSEMHRIAEVINQVVTAYRVFVDGGDEKTLKEQIFQKALPLVQALLQEFPHTSHPLTIPPS